MTTTTPPGQPIEEIIWEVWFGFKVTEQWKPITPLFCNPLKDQIHDARHEANILGYIEDPVKDTG